MSIFLHAGCRVLIQGLTGKMGRFSATDLRAYGTAVVAGVVPGRAGEALDGVPIFADVQSAVAETGADTALVYVPPEAALDAVQEAFEGGCRLVVYPGDGLPVQDAIAMRAAAQAAGGTLVGPNTPGLISPGRAKAGFMPSQCFLPGSLGVISRSGSLSYEVCRALTQGGLGQSTVIGIGGDPVKGVTAAEALEAFHADGDTRAVLVVGEIGGRDEYEVAAYAERDGAKPTAALVVGRTAPPGRKMGHAAALIGGVADTHAAKVERLRAAGVFTADIVTDVVPTAAAALQRAEAAANQPSAAAGR
jgi:succinyl-CoA synthetase alpha subunit